MSTALAPCLSIVQGQPRASSLKIAEHFGKRHDNVLRLVRSVQAEAPGEFNALNFEEVEFPDAKGEKRPAILMTRDGFTLVVMGFTGKKALEWKLRYIEAFNKMEEELRSGKAQAALPLSTVEDRKPLRALVHTWSAVSGLSHQAIYAQLLGHFNLAQASELPLAWIPDALAFIQERIDAAQPKALPPARKESTVRDYAKIYKNLPKDASLWKDLERRLLHASCAYGRELHEISKLASNPFAEFRKSDIGTFFDDVMDPIRDHLKAAESAENAAFCHTMTALKGYKAAHAFLTRG